tara:strand:+ start:119 stop:355 length:237 start_codon:yes stop_codon:yes gene_type:complete
MMSSDGTNVVRVSEDEASKLYHNENFKYVAKSVWKEKTRDVNKEPELNEDTGETEMVTKKSNKMSKAQKRHLKKIQIK